MTTLNSWVDAPSIIDDAYRAGSCNIGPEEIARRRRFGLLGVTAAGLLAAGLVVADAPPAARLLVALPLAGGMTGLLQARLRFCAGFGMRGVSNFGPVGRTNAVEDATARAADRRRALEISGSAAAIGLIGGIAFALLPR
jgi:hypothetical protein